VPAATQKADTIEALIRRVEAIKAQKAELDKAEKETLTLLREKLQQQEQRLRKLGVIPDPKPGAIAPATSY
jgi:hypothetical protein